MRVGVPCDLASSQGIDAWAGVATQVRTIG